MNPASDSAELAPSRDPQAYARRPLLGAAFWMMMAFCVLCLLAAGAVVVLGPRLAPVRKAAEVEATSPQTAAPGPASVAQDVASPATPSGDLGARVQRLESGQSRIADAAAGALAAAALSDAAAKPAPFSSDLAAVSRLLPGSPEALALAPLAAEGAPTRSALAAELTDIASQVAAAAHAPGKNASFMDRAYYAFSRVVTVRRVDANATGMDAILAKAERAADDGDLEGAVVLLDRLPDPTKAVLAPWREKAERRVQIDQHIAALRSQAMANLAAVQASQGGGGPA